MRIITLNNELFECDPDPFRRGGQTLYHSGEVSLLVNVYEGGPAYYAALPGRVNGLYLYSGERGNVPAPTNRRADQGPMIPEHLALEDEGAPIFGEIPPEYKELLVEAITRLTAYRCYQYEELINQLIQTKHRLKDQK